MDTSIQPAFLNGLMIIIETNSPKGMSTRTKKFVAGLKKVLVFLLEENGFQGTWKIRPIKMLSNLQGDLKWIRPEKTYIVGKAKIKEIIWTFNLTPDLSLYRVEDVFEKMTSKNENISENKKLCKEIDEEIDEGIDEEMNKKKITIEDLSDAEEVALMVLDEIKNEENEIAAKLAGPAIRKEISSELTSQKILVKLTQLEIIERLCFRTTIEGANPRTKGYRITQAGLDVLNPVTEERSLGNDVEASEGLVDDDNIVEDQEILQISDRSMEVIMKACDSLTVIGNKLKKNISQKEKFVRLIDEADEENKTLNEDRIRKEREIKRLASELGFDLESLLG
jgi:hypothetical protein